MSPRVVVLHPEDLLDRARGRGAPLGPLERSRLGAHLASCTVCAWERAAMDDFACLSQDDDTDGDLGALVDGALARALPVPARRAAVQGPRPARWASLGAAAAIAAAVAAVLMPAAHAFDPGRDAAPLVASEAGLDAGAIGAPSGGDS